MSVQDAKLLLAMGASFSFLLPYFLGLYRHNQKIFLSKKKRKKILDLVFPPKKRHSVNKELLEFAHNLKTTFSHSEKSKEQESKNQNQPSDDITENDSANSDVKFCEKIISKYHKYLCLSNFKSLRKSKNRTPLDWYYYIAFAVFIFNSTGLVMLIMEIEILTNFIPSESFPYLIIGLCFLLPILLYVLPVLISKSQKWHVWVVWFFLKRGVKKETDKNKKRKKIKDKLKEKYHSEMEDYIKDLNKKRYEKT